MLDVLLNVTLSIPMVQLILLMLMSTMSLLFGKLKLALLINYLFALHWGYILNRNNLMDMGFENFQLFTFIYFIFGLGIVLVAAFAFMFQKNTYRRDVGFGYILQHPSKISIIKSAVTPKLVYRIPPAEFYFGVVPHLTASL